MKGYDNVHVSDSFDYDSHLDIHNHAVTEQQPDHILSASSFVDENAETKEVHYF